MVSGQSNSGQGSKNQPASGSKKQPEVTSPTKARKPRGRKPNAAAPDGAGGGRTTGVKRKQLYKVKTPVLAIADFPASRGDDVCGNELSHHDADNLTEGGGEQQSGDSNKKQKNSEIGTTTRSADLAEAVNQPRHSQ